MITNEASLESTESKPSLTHALKSAMQEELKRRTSSIQQHKGTSADESIIFARQWLSDDVDLETGQSHDSSKSEYHYRAWYSRSEPGDNTIEIVLSINTRLHQWPAINKLLATYIQENIDHRCHSVATFFETTTS